MKTLFIGITVHSPECCKKVIEWVAVSDATWWKITEDGREDLMRIKSLFSMVNTVPSGPLVNMDAAATEVEAALNNLHFWWVC